MMSTIDEKEIVSKIHPKKFGLYLACASIVMMFAGLTSAYIVRQGAMNWAEFAMPKWFFISTAVILSSSVALHASYLAFKKGNATMYRTLLVVAFALGLVFMVTQYLGWQALHSYGLDLKENHSFAFILAISGLHAAHVLGGIAAIAIALIHAFTLKYAVTEKRLLRFEMTLHYWHFVDILWVYLLLFFIFQK
jgi:cytochrome c oxidase subunit III